MPRSDSGCHCIQHGKFAWCFCGQIASRLFEHIALPIAHVRGLSEKLPYRAVIALRKRMFASRKSAPRIRFFFLFSTVASSTSAFTRKRSAVHSMGRIVGATRCPQGRSRDQLVCGGDAESLRVGWECDDATPEIVSVVFMLGVCRKSALPQDCLNSRKGALLIQNLCRRAGTKIGRIKRAARIHQSARQSVGGNATLPPYINDLDLL